MKYFEFTFRTQPCTETVNDVLAAILGEVGFESFVECEGGLTAYIQQTLCDENAIKIAINEFPHTRYGYYLYIYRSGRQGLERRMGKEFLPTHHYRKPMCDPQHFPPRCPQSGI